MHRRRAQLLEGLELRRLLNSYWVSPSGDDTAAGTSGAPWATLQHAALTVVAGDTVTVKAGNYVGFQMGWDFQNSGTANAPIIWNAEPGADIISRNNKTADGIDLEGVSYIVINGFVVNNNNGLGQIDRAGIRAVEDNHITITNCTTVNNGTWGIYTSHSDDVLVDHNLSANNNAINPDYFNHHGIYISNSAQRPIVRNNVVYGNHGNGIHFNGDATQGGSGVVSNALVENNIIYDNGSFGGSGINMDGVQNSVIQNNLLFDNHAKGISLYQIDAAAPSINNVVVNNTVIMPDGAQYALNIKNGSTGNKVYNNILLNRDSVEGAMNISLDSLPGLVSDYNAVTGRFTLDDGATSIPLTTWQTAAGGQDLHSFVSTSAALFVDPSSANYHLKAGSPAIDAGTLTSAPTTDLEHNFRPAGLAQDLGAFEFGAVGVPGVPKTPSNLTGTAASSTKIQLYWGDKADNEGGYRVERSTNAQPFQPIAWLNANSTSFLDSSLLPSTSYSYRVIALNASGDSDPSNVAAATTLAVTPPASLLALPASFSSIALSWSDADPTFVPLQHLPRHDHQLHPRCRPPDRNQHDSRLC